MNISTKNEINIFLFKFKMSQRLSKICIDSNSDLEEENNTYELDNSENKKNKIILFFDELFYDLYFKYTDIRFYVECLDDDDKIKIYKTLLSLMVIILLIIITYIIIIILV